MKMHHQVAYILMVVGGLNWGLVGLFNFNLVNAILGSWPGVERIVYVLVGLATAYECAVLHKKTCKICGEEKGI